jgi:pimeloyl-ACP methyl ester carboxylesterase
MKRLGYTRFVAQGGDWGAIITEEMGTQAPPELLGIHTNFPGTVPPEISRPLAANEVPPAGLSVDEERAFYQLGQFFIRHAAFAAEMRARPQTLYEIADSPIGLAAWMLDHDPKSYALIAGAFDDAPSGLSRDDVLDNITLTWLTNTAISSARLYWENRLPWLDAKHVTIPVAVSVFPDEIYQAPRSWTERAFSKLIYFNQLDRGGHYAAWEQPELLVGELRAGLKSLRT